MPEAKKTTGFYLKKIAGILLLLSLAAVFLYSAISKLDSLEPFSWTFMDILPIGLTTAGVLARVFIGFEFLIGLFLLAHVFLSSFTYKATLAFLALLSIYLIFLLVKEGNSGSCGCFGEWLYMHPSQALIKNIIMMAAVVLLMYIYPGKGYNNIYYVAAFLATASLVAPFVVHPMAIYGSGEKASDPIDLNALYDGKASPTPAVDLRKGKHIVAYFSLTCPHCRKGAYLLQIMHRQYPEFPLYMVLNGNPGMLKDFFKETKSRDVPHSFMADLDPFKQMAGDYVPAIFWINNSVIERKTYFTEISPADVKAWLSEK